MRRDSHNAEQVIEALERAFRTAGHDPRRWPEGGRSAADRIDALEVPFPGDNQRAVRVTVLREGVRVRAPEGDELPQTGPIPWDDDRLGERLWDCLTPYFHDLPRLELR